MNEHQTIAAISINLLRIAQWHYLDPKGNVDTCQRYLDQSKQLARHVTSPQARTHLDTMAKLDFESSSESTEHQAERFLTLGVLLQHPEKWL